jgi:hypothetical protein
MRCTHRLVIAAVCGGVLVVVARFRAARVPNADDGTCPFGDSSTAVFSSTDITSLPACLAGWAALEDLGTSPPRDRRRGYS